LEETPTTETQRHRESTTGSGLQTFLPSTPNSPDKDNFWVQFARYSQLAFVLPAATAAGWLIGLGLDKWLHTTWLYLVGLLLGIVAGFVELVRTAMSDSGK
jgi:F0F1-type ATP synthase assembly protein I